jgi:hypothetical protein
MKKYFTVALIIFVLLGFFCTLVSAQSTETTEIPEGFVFYHYQDEYLDFSFIYPEKWINQSSREKGIIIYFPEFKGTLTFRRCLYLEKNILLPNW